MRECLHGLRKDQYPHWAPKSKSEHLDLNTQIQNSCNVEENEEDSGYRSEPGFLRIRIRLLRKVGSVSGLNIQIQNLLWNHGFYNRWLLSSLCAHMEKDLVYHIIRAQSEKSNDLIKKPWVKRTLEYSSAI